MSNICRIGHLNRYYLNKMKDELIIRDYKSDDFKEVNNIWNELEMGSSERGDTAEIIQKTLNNNAKLIVLEKNNKIIGTSWITSDYRRLFLHHFAICPDHHIEPFTKEKKKKHIIEDYNTPGLILNSFDIKFNKSNTPNAIEKDNITINNYATTSSSRLFLTPNFNCKQIYSPEKLENRTTKIIIHRNYSTIDSIVYTIPENYSPESIFGNITKKSIFGNFNININVEKNKITYIRNITINKGVYPPSEYQNFYNFFKDIRAIDKRKLVFKKNN